LKGGEERRGKKVTGGDNPKTNLRRIELGKKGSVSKSKPERGESKQGRKKMPELSSSAKARIVRAGETLGGGGVTRLDCRAHSRKRK